MDEKLNDIKSIEDEKLELIHKLNITIEKYENLETFYKNKYTIMTFKFTNHEFNISGFKKLENDFLELENKHNFQLKNLENYEQKFRSYE